MSVHPIPDIYRDGPDFLGSHEFAIRNPIMRALQDASNKITHGKGQPKIDSKKDELEKDDGRVQVNLLKTWEKISDETEHIDVTTLRLGDVIEIHFGRDKAAYRFRVISEFEPDIIRPSNFAGNSPIRLQMIIQEGGYALDCMYGDTINPEEELHLLGSSIGGSTIHVNFLDLGTYIALKKSDGTGVHTLPVSKV